MKKKMRRDEVILAQSLDKDEEAFLRPAALGK
jgi:hypothetical protein